MQKRLVNREIYKPFQMKVLGLEPKTYGLKGRCSTNVKTVNKKSCNSGKKISANHSANFASISDDLKQIIDLWPTLPEDTKQRILDMVQSVCADDGTS